MNESTRSDFTPQFPGIMAQENADSAKSITVELKIYMHCDACERLVRRVEALEVDREENKIAVTGDFKTERLLRKIKKKTGKKAEILIPQVEENEEEGNGGEPDAPYDDLVQDQETFVVHHFESRWPRTWDDHYFDDENTEGCVVM
ncbi:hypothetical protein QOZ80_4AG0311650 [Eleusine coracana subsp. coracana]|nr:hypothetical protein QOZ80_4AG0311650 [Eleusine coracana subsp. coracana]